MRLVCTLLFLMSAPAPAASVGTALATNASTPQPVHVFTASTDQFSDAPTAENATVPRNSEVPRNSSSDAVQQSNAADLAWPLQPVTGFDQFDYHGVSNFVDHDPRFPHFVQDYTCGSRTYDLASGYNHAGTDYFLWPYPWLMTDESQVRILAAAPGILVRKDDGNFDRNCALDGNSDPNDVYVQQDDGFTAIYLHMRKGSLTTKAIGERVETGEYLGMVGSSGNSTAPHLHFELRDANNQVVDPRHGQCNASPDLWTVTQLYEDPHIDTISTHSAEPQFVDCGVDATGNPVEENPNFKDVFKPGDALWVFTSYRDQRNGEVTKFSIARPDGSEFATWDFDLASQNNPKSFYSGTGADWQFALPNDAPAGTWTITAAFQGQTYVKTFAVSTAPAAPGIAIGGYMSGSWYNPSQSGSGFLIEAATNNVMVAIWFVFAPVGGGENWIFAEGPYDHSKNSVTLSAYILSGAKFPPSFNPGDVTRTPWGDITFTFADCDHGAVSWSSILPGYASGSYPISRLTQIDGTACPQ
jgi:murein DD-endopeptidase MepM/ murein hydrolase activator NlpD